MSIRPDTNTPGAPTKVDNGMNLAGKQVISGGIVGVEEHLPYSPAQGFPLWDGAFEEGKEWAWVTGKIHAGQGPANADWAPEK